MECYCEDGTPVYDEQLWDLAEEYNTNRMLGCATVCPCRLMAPRYRSKAQRWLDEANEMQRELAVEQQIIAERNKESERKAKEKEERKESKPGKWLFWTFTQPDTDKCAKRIIKAVQKTIKSKQINPVQYAYSIELTKSGTPHIHLRLFVEGYVDYRVPVGFNNGYDVKMLTERTVTGASNYIIKDDTKPTPEQLESWGVTSWFFRSENYSGPLPENASSSCESRSPEKEGLPSPSPDSPA